MSGGNREPRTRWRRPWSPPTLVEIPAYPATGARLVYDPVEQEVPKDMFRAVESSTMNGPPTFFGPS